MIDEVYSLVNYISDKNGRGYIPPAKFNLLAKTCQLEFISTRLGNLRNPVPGYKSNRRVDTDLRPFLYGPISVPIRSNGDFTYPDGFMWQDSWQKLDFSPITDIQSDQYPAIKKSVIIPPTEDNPIIIFNNPYGFIDPYSIGSFLFSYVKYPDDPVWGYDVVNDEPVYNPNTSVDFKLGIISMMDITALILEKVGMNLNKDSILSYAVQKQIQGT